MYSPKLETNGGHRYMTVWYSSDRRDFTEIIRDAFNYHGIDEQEARTMPVIVMPIKMETK